MGVDARVGAIPAWQTFKTKPRGCSQALIHRMQTRRQIFITTENMTVYYPFPDLLQGCEGEVLRLHFIFKYARIPMNTVLLDKVSDFPGNRNYMLSKNHVLSLSSAINHNFHNEITVYLLKCYFKDYFYYIVLFLLCSPIFYNNYIILYHLSNFISFN